MVPEGGGQARCWGHISFAAAFSHETPPKRDLNYLTCIILSLRILQVCTSHTLICVFTEGSEIKRSLGTETPFKVQRKAVKLKMRWGRNIIYPPCCSSRAVKRWWLWWFHRTWSNRERLSGSVLEGTWTHQSQWILVCTSIRTSEINSTDVTDVISLVSQPILSHKHHNKFLNAQRQHTTREQLMSQITKAWWHQSECCSKRISPSYLYFRHHYGKAGNKYAIWWVVIKTWRSSSDSDY